MPKKREKDGKFEYMVAGVTEPGAAPVPVQRPAADSESPFWRQFQTEGQSAHLGTVAGHLRRRRGRSDQVEGHFVRHGLADDQPCRHCQVCITSITFIGLLTLIPTYLNEKWTFSGFFFCHFGNLSTFFFSGIVYFLFLSFKKKTFYLNF